MSAVLKLPTGDRERASLFRLRKSVNGNWIVEGPGNRCGGIFVDEAAARHFIREEERAAIARQPARTAICLFRTTPTPWRTSP